MMGKESTQHKLDRIRSPRVQITYDVETGGAIEMKELPFVMGIMADLSGHPEQPLPNLKDPKRKFVEIDRDNFDEVLKGMAPRLAYKVDSKLTDDDSKIGVELKFGGIDDFGPEQVANQVEPLRKLVEVRKQLSALLAKADGNDKLAEKLQEIIKDTELQQKIGKETGIGETKEGPNG
jgi:type VI secretion system protein ImpB